MKTIVYASDNKFFPIMAASIASLLEHNQNCLIVILSNNIANSNIQMLQGYINLHDSKLKIVEINDTNFKSFEKMRSTKQWPLIAFLRLHIEEIIDEDIEKILYLDCDTIINASLAELFELNIDDCYCAGVSDCMDKVYKKRIGLNDTQLYINSGVILYNLKKMRTNNLCSKIDKLIDENRDLYKYPDQDVINVAYKNNIKELPLKYNVMTQFFGFEYRDFLKYRNVSVYYDKNEYDLSCEKPSIIHYANGFTYARPWYKHSNHPYADLFADYYRKINGELVYWDDDNRTSKQLIICRIHGAIPKTSVLMLKFLRKINNR